MSGGCGTWQTDDDDATLGASYFLPPTSDESLP